MQELSSAWERKKSEMAVIGEEQQQQQNFISTSNYDHPPRRHHHHRQEASSSSSASSTTSMAPMNPVASTATGIAFSSLQQDSGFESSSEATTQPRPESSSPSSREGYSIPSDYSSVERRLAMQHSELHSDRDYENVSPPSPEARNYENVSPLGVVAGEEEEEEKLRRASSSTAYSTLPQQKKSQNVEVLKRAAPKSSEIPAETVSSRRPSGGGGRGGLEKPPRSTKRPQEAREEEPEYQNIDSVLTCQVKKTSTGQAKSSRSISSSVATAAYKKQQQQQLQKKTMRSVERASTSPSVYQNVDFAQANSSLLMLATSSYKSMQKNGNNKLTTTGCQTNKISKAKEVSSTSSYPKVRKASRNLESPATYENCEFGGEKAVYQNVIAQQGGRMRPAGTTYTKAKANANRSKSVGSMTSKAIQQKAVVSSSNNNNNEDDDEVYAKVKFLRKQVQEVNALLERPGSKRRSKSHSGVKSPLETSNNNNNRRKSTAAATSSLIVPRPSPSSLTEKKRYLPSLPHRVEPARKVEVDKDEEFEIVRKRSESAITLQKNTCLTSSERRRQHFRALLSRFDSSPDCVAHVQAADRRKSSLPVSGEGGEVRMRSTSLVRDRRQRFSMEVEKEK